MICSLCQERAIVSQRYLGRHLCQHHFLQDFERRVVQTIERNRMIEREERIAVAVSGGKDSTALLFALNKVLAEKEVEMVAVTVDEGIAGYRNDTIVAAERIARQLGVEQVIVSFQKEYGWSLDEMVVGKEVAPCTYCGVFRKNALNCYAKRLGASRLATGHNQDDEAQSVMMNYLKGDMERLMRFRPRREQPGLVPRIKPLRDIPEKEIALYAMINSIYFESRECPYARLSLRADVRDMMNRMESLFPGTRQRTIQGFERIERLCRGGWAQMELAECRKCGEPCVGGKCKACELLGKMQE